MRVLVRSIFFQMITLWVLSAAMPAAAQPIFLEEDFDTWFSSCAPNWNCLNLGSCAGSTCRWNRQDLLPQNSLPAPLDCGGSGFYARCHTQDLNPGEAPVLISSQIDLSGYTDTTALAVHLCMVNASQGSSDTDTLWLDASPDGGLNWTSVWFNDSVFQSWNQRSIVLPKNLYTSAFQFRFRVTAFKGSGDIGVDNIEIRPRGAICQARSSSISVDKSTLICESNSSYVLNFGTDYVGSGQYQYILTDSLDRVLSQLQGTQLDAAILPEGVYRIYGISYTGNLSYFPLQPVFSLQASQCEVFASNSIEIQIYQPRLDLEIRSDYNGYEISRKGAKDGRASVVVGGGFAPYKIVWETPIPVIGAHANTLPAGTWEVVVTDSEGCQTRQSITLTEPDSLVLDLTATHIPVCADDSSGAILSAVNGGVPPYTFAWSNGDSSKNLSNLPGDEYTLLLTDANGVKVQDEISLLSHPALEANIEIERPLCSKKADAKVFVSVQGGQPPYLYEWSDGPRTASRDLLPEGLYTLSIKDDLGCELLKEVLIQPSPDTLAIEGLVQQAICGEDSLGDILVEITGGKAPYDILWSNGSMARDLFDVGAGIYEVMVTDSQGCTAEKEFSLAPPPTLEVDLAVEPDNGESKGSIAVAVSGGTPPYSLNWGFGSSSPKLDSLQNGFYELSIEDANGCRVDSSVLVPYDPSLPGICNELELGFSPNGDGVNDFFVLPCLENYKNHSLEIYNRWGQLLYTKQNYTQDWDGTVDGRSLSEGSYFWVATIYIGGRAVNLNGTLVIVR